MNIIAIVQARMGSKRLPNKVLLDIGGVPLIGRVINRVKFCNSIDEIVLATTKNSEDDQLVDWAINHGIKVFRGSQDDVLDRFYSCAVKFNADVVVRITADDPLKDSSIIDMAISMILSNEGIDYVSNTINPSYPEGLDVEVFRFRALKVSFHEAVLVSEREHVTPYMWKNPHKFTIVNFQMVPDLSQWRWTVDRSQDVEFARKVYENFKDNPLIGYKKIIDFLRKNPELMQINTGILRNEGYIKSLSRDDHG